jgi:hypothetical protein
MAVNDQIHIPATLYPLKKQTLDCTAGWVSSGAGLGCYGEKENFSPLPKIKPQFRFPGHSIVTISTELNTAHVSVQNILTSDLLPKKHKD